MRSFEMLREQAPAVWMEFHARERERANNERLKAERKQLRNSRPLSFEVREKRILNARVQIAKQLSIIDGLQNRNVIIRGDEWIAVGQLPCLAS